MRRFLKYVLPATVLTGTLIAFQNCTKAGFGTDGASLQNLNAAFGGPAICDPLSGSNGGTNTSADQGLIGALIYESAANQQTLGTATSFADLVAKGTVAPATLFMSQVNVPTRAFTEGFAADGAHPLIDDSTGQKLVEWFGIDVKSVVKLGAGDQAGFYQFATISDDGSLLLANGRTLVDNDGIHSTTAKCSVVAIPFDGTTALPVEFQYLQGPRTEIAAQVAWRKVASATPDQANCGASSAGWTIIPAKNFFLPSGAPANPCH